MRSRGLFFPILVSLLAAGCGGGGGTSRDAGAGTDAAPSDGGATDAPPTPDGGSPGDGGAPDGGDPSDGGDPFGDAGDPFGDGGALGTPEWVELTVGPPGTCDALVPCGGDVRGTWDVSGGCFEIDVDGALSECPGAMATRYEGQGRGRVVFDETVAHRVAQSRVEIDVFFPAICATYYSCDMLETALAAAAGDATCTTETSGACRCTARHRTEIDDTDFYTVEGDEIVSTTSGKRWAFCIEGDALRYEDTSPTGPREPGTVHLARRE